MALCTVSDKDLKIIAEAMKVLAETTSGSSEQMGSFGHGRAQNVPNVQDARGQTQVQNVDKLQEVPVTKRAQDVVQIAQNAKEAGEQYTDKMQNVPVTMLAHDVQTVQQGAKGVQFKGDQIFERAGDHAEASFDGGQARA